MQQKNCKYIHCTRTLTNDVELQTSAENLVLIKGLFSRLTETMNKNFKISTVPKGTIYLLKDSPYTIKFKVLRFGKEVSHRDRLD